MSIFSDILYYFKRERQWYLKVTDCNDFRNNFNVEILCSTLTINAFSGNALNWTEAQPELYLINVIARTEEEAKDKSIRLATESKLNYMCSLNKQLLREIEESKQPGDNTDTKEEVHHPEIYRHLIIHR
jgi:hypothetical protein